MLAAVATGNLMQTVLRVSARMRIPDLFVFIRVRPHLSTPHQKAAVPCDHMHLAHEYRLDEDGCGRHLSIPRKQDPKELPS